MLPRWTLYKGSAARAGRTAAAVVPAATAFNAARRVVFMGVWYAGRAKTAKFFSLPFVRKSIQ
jgi:hypothetical protein